MDLSQTAFIKDRSIVDNIHLAQELFRKYTRKNASPRCVLKVDIQKAYDTVHWGFIQEALQYLQFPQIFIGWIMECVSTTAFSVSINGNMHGFSKEKEAYDKETLSRHIYSLYVWKCYRDL